MPDATNSESLVLVCPGCQKQFKITGSNLLGRRARCKSCGASFIVDGGVGAKIAEDVAQEQPAKETETTRAIEPPATPVHELNTFDDAMLALSSRPPKAEDLKSLAFGWSAYAQQAGRVFLTLVSLYIGYTVTDFAVFHSTIHGVAFAIMFVFGLSMFFVVPVALWKAIRNRKYFCIAGVIVALVTYRTVFNSEYTIDEESDLDLKRTIYYGRWSGDPIRMWIRPRDFSFSAQGGLSPSGKFHGKWETTLIPGFTRTTQFYWYGEKITEGEWHLRNK